jgi:hypothetical protein
MGLSVSFTVFLQKITKPQGMVRIIILSIITGLVFQFSSEIGLASHIHPTKWYIWAFYGATSYLSHILMQLGFDNDRKYFVQFYLTTIVSRMFLSLAFVGYFIYQDTPNIYIFITNFFVLYLCYTGFEIYDLYRNLQHIS